MAKGRDESWKDEWKDMPEFIQEDLTSHRKIIVHFRNDEDVAEFEEMMKQNITPKQKSIWWPHMPPRRYADKRYVDEDDFKGEDESA